MLGQKPSPASPSVNPQLLAAMQAALKLNPLTADLSEEERLDIALMALREGRMQDATWLEDVALRLKSGENLSVPTAGASEGQPAAAPSATAPGGKPPIEITISRPQSVESLEHWEEIMTAHAAWIKKVLEPGLDIGAGRANLKGCDLRAFPLEGRDLRAANLEGCDLSGCSLITTNLAGANLNRAKLIGAKLDRARLRRSNLNGADFTDASLRGADLRHAQTLQTKWLGADLSGTCLEGKFPPPSLQRAGAEGQSREESPASWAGAPDACES